MKRQRRESVLVLNVRASGGVIAEKLAVRIVIPMSGKTRLPTHAHAARRRRDALVRRHDERVPPLVRQVVVLPEHGQLDGAKVLRDLGEREPADLDEAEEPLGREQAVVLVRVAHVPVGRDERRHGVEHLGRLARVGQRRLVRKVAHLDPGRSQTLPAFFGRRLDDGEVRRDFRWDGRGGFGRVGGGRSGCGGGIDGI